MKITLVISPEECGGERLARAFMSAREVLRENGVLYPRAPGKGNHTKLWLASHDADHMTLTRHLRGYSELSVLAMLQRDLKRELKAEITVAQPRQLLLVVSQMLMLDRPSEIETLKALLADLSDDVEIILHVDEHARVLTRAFAAQVFLGRTSDLTVELGLDADDWGQAAASAGQGLRFPEVIAPPLWLDFEAQLAAWERVFGAGVVTLRAAPTDIAAEAAALCGLAPTLFDSPPSGDEAISLEWLNRCRAMNGLLWGLWDKGSEIPRPQWWKVLTDLNTPGPRLQAGQLAAISQRFAASRGRLVKRFAGLDKALTPDMPIAAAPDFKTESWFRASQYFAASLPRIADILTKSNVADANDPNIPTEMPLAARELARRLAKGRFAPHNNLGAPDDQPGAVPYTRANAKPGTVVIACMKNEGPYILEWIAYHREIGVEKFVVYTNDCSDGTDRILARLGKLGLVEHRDNNKWRGKSPQQSALNQAMREPVVQNAEWLAHIDVDEFINIRTGNGTLDDLRAKIGGATNVAMTWRLFGAAGVRAFADAPVIGQFDLAAPKYCPKPHTAWGFKTLFRNIGAYQKLSCHRPNQLTDAGRERVVWVNGSGDVMPATLADKGWRSEIPTAGFDLVQLNHYALRSAESFLIKRQRGRALHVDRSIGIAYWIRNDWSDFRDTTIQRNLPRLRAGMAELLADKQLRALHENAVGWHQVRARELRNLREFAELYERTAELKLTPLDRAAWSLALDLNA